MVTTPSQRFPVKIGARWYSTDLQLFERMPLKSIAQSFDTAREPGEQSLGNEGVWKRSQFDFIHGAGQTNFDDDEENDRRRFGWSLGCDIWTRGQVSALPLTAAVDSSVGDGTYAEMTVLGSTLFHAVSASPAVIRKTTDGTTWSDCTGEPNITTGFSLVALGQYVYLSSGAALERADETGAFAALGALTPTYLIAAADRLIGLEDNRIYEIDNLGARGNDNTDIFAHFDSTYEFKGGVYGPSGVYVFGDDGTRSTVQLMVPVDATTEFAAPYPVMELPEGELIRDMKYYGGFIILATSLGFRLAQISSNGVLIWGPLREVGDVQCLAVQKQFCWFGWSATDGDYLGLTTRTGLGRMGLDRFTEPLVPTYASDLLTPSGTQTTLCCAWFAGQMYFGIDAGSSATAYTEHASDFVPTMGFSTGHINYGIPELKAITSVEIRHSALAASQTVDATVLKDYATPVSAGTQSATDGDKLSRFVPSASIEADSMLLYFQVETNNNAFSFYRWTLRSLPMVRRVERIRIGVLLFEVVGDDFRTQVRIDPQAEFEYLLSLQAAQTLTTLVMGDRSDTVYVDAITVNQNQGPQLVEDWDTQGFINATWIVEMLTNADS